MSEPLKIPTLQEVEARLEAMKLERRTLISFKRILLRLQSPPVDTRPEAGSKPATSESLSEGSD